MMFLLADKPSLAAKVGGLKSLPGQISQINPKGLVPGLQQGNL